MITRLIFAVSLLLLPISLHAQYLGFYYMGYEEVPPSSGLFEWVPLTDVSEGSISLPSNGPGLTFAPASTAASYLATTAEELTVGLAVAAGDTFTFSLETGPTDMIISSFRVGSVSANYFGNTFVPYSAQVDVSTDSTFSTINFSQAYNVPAVAAVDTFTWVDLTTGDTYLANTEYFFRFTFFGASPTNPSDLIFADDYFIIFDVIPEPSTWVLVCVGFCWLLLVRRRTNRSV